MSWKGAGMIRSGMRRKIASQMEKAKQQEDIKALKQRWTRYPLPIQAMLDTHLHLYGASSAHDTTDIVDRFLTAALMKGNTDVTPHD